MESTLYQEAHVSGFFSSWSHLGLGTSGSLSLQDQVQGTRGRWVFPEKTEKGQLESNNEEVSQFLANSSVAELYLQIPGHFWGVNSKFGWTDILLFSYFVYYSYIFKSGALQTSFPMGVLNLEEGYADISFK